VMALSHQAGAVVTCDRCAEDRLRRRQVDRSFRRDPDRKGSREMWFGPSSPACPGVISLVREARGANGRKLTAMARLNACVARTLPRLPILLCRGRGLHGRQCGAPVARNHRDPAMATHLTRCQSCDDPTATRERCVPMSNEEFVRKAYEIAELTDIPGGSRACVQSLGPRDVDPVAAQSYVLMGR
jgi:hypothetical protein